MKIVINRCWGGFSLSKKVLNKLGIDCEDYDYVENGSFGIVDEHNYQAYRAHPPLIEAILEVGLYESAGPHSQLKIVEVPDDLKWYIDDYDGMEVVHEVHQSFS
jgi:hypothetical protein